ncbi:hypothetical protein ABEB36_007713 [Hypothenemus hampei]|uniref:Uncharacterized protein n=1 Tax=Hypothenemus hampei TaxID=57062 RepID=A0ABD1EV01_HYPHA
MKRKNNINAKVLTDIQHNELSSLKALKLINQAFHWSSLIYPQTGDTALHVAARLGYTSTIDHLLNEYIPCAVNVRNNDDKTPLHEAAQFNQLQSVLMLLTHGADVNALKRADWTPLMLACTKIQPGISLSIVKALVENGANVNVQNKDGWTCTHIIAREGSKEIFEYLVNAGLIVNAKTKNQRTALHIAALHGNIDILPSLIFKVDINSKDACGNTPFHESILGQHIDIGDYLFMNGADIWIENHNGFNALHLAASQDNSDVINYLINQLNFHVNTQSRNGWTAAHCAARKRCYKVFMYLEENGADMSIKDNFDRTPRAYLT